MGSTYIKRIDDTIAALKSKDMPVFWVGLPPIRGTKSSADATFLNDLYRSRAEKAGITYIDVWDGFVDEAGRYSPQGPDYEGQIRRLRAGDGVYFTKAGARKLAHYVEREIQRAMVNRGTPVALPVPVEPVPQAPTASRAGRRASDGRTSGAADRNRRRGRTARRQRDAAPPRRDRQARARPRASRWRRRPGARTISAGRAAMSRSSRRPTRDATTNSPDGRRAGRRPRAAGMPPAAQTAEAGRRPRAHARGRATRASRESAALVLGSQTTAAGRAPIRGATRRSRSSRRSISRSSARWLIDGPRESGFAS